MSSDTTQLIRDILMPLMMTETPPLTNDEFREFNLTPHKFPAVLAALQNMLRAHRGNAGILYAAAAADRVAREKKA